VSSLEQYAYTIAFSVMAGLCFTLSFDAPVWVRFVLISNGVFGVASASAFASRYYFDHEKVR
jgi:hypothetical protein